MGLIDDEELVGPLEQIVGLARHGIFHDLDQIFGANRLAAIVRDADQQRTAAPLIVRGDR